MYAWLLGRLTDKGTLYGRWVAVRIVRAIPYEE